MGPLGRVVGGVLAGIGRVAASRGAEERSLVLESSLEESESEEEPESESPELSEEAPATPLARFQSLSTSSKLAV